MVTWKLCFQTPSSLQCLIICLVSLVVTAGLIGVFAAFSYTGTSYQIRGTQHVTMEHIFNGTFAAEKRGVRWVPEGRDIFSSFDPFLMILKLEMAYSLLHETIT